MSKTIGLNKIDKNGDYLLWRESYGDTIEIVDIAVYSERQKGVGRSMFEELDKTKNIFAFCRDTNEGAIAFYKKLGFKGTFVPNFYKDSNAYIFIHEASK